MQSVLSGPTDWILRYIKTTFIFTFYIPLASEVLEVNCERPDREETRKAISLLKTGKAPGPDEIQAIKADIEPP